MSLNFKIVKYSDEYRDQVLSVWEKSVSATHNFLKPDDFQSIKEFVHSLDFNTLNVYCLLCKNDVTGFVGIACQKVEMLFLSPEFIGKGLGKLLMDFAINEMKINKVDVNEQNQKAVRFYTQLGFITYERSPKDDQGNDYPILRMKLSHH